MTELQLRSTTISLNSFISFFPASLAKKGQSLRHSRRRTKARKPSVEKKAAKRNKKKQRSLRRYASKHAFPVRTSQCRGAGAPRAREGGIPVIVPCCSLLDWQARQAGRKTRNTKGTTRKLALLFVPFYVFLSAWPPRIATKLEGNRHERDELKPCRTLIACEKFDGLALCRRKGERVRRVCEIARA